MISGMQTIEEVRRARLALLEAEAGSQAKLADLLDKSPAQLSQWKNASPTSTGRGRAMSSDVARDIEITLEKPRGWMDTPLAPENPAAAFDRPRSQWPFDVAQERLQVLEPRDWDMLNNTIRTVVEVREGDLRSRKSTRAQA